jgi:hypothetical protein
MKLSLLIVLSDFYRSSRKYGCSHTSQKAARESDNYIAFHRSHSLHFLSTHYLQFLNNPKPDLSACTLQYECSFLVCKPSNSL